ncbi:RNase adapter RapZ [Tatumella citrea]|uniref:RNase adapter RapZ n=1 Tax=Tatumella citrea TaxID=53336 RepID=UPI000B3C3401
MNSDLTLELSHVLTLECTRNNVHCQSKKRALEIISELAATQLNLPHQTIFETILNRERMGSTGIGNGIAIPHGKLEEDTLRTIGVLIHLEHPIPFDAVDNQPVDLLPELANSLEKRNISAAVSIDVRNMPESPEIFEDAFNRLSAQFSPQLLFLDADRNTLIRRYSDTRRLHPLSSKNLSLESAIDEESDLLEPLRSRADLIIDTSEMSVHELAEMLRTRLLGKRERELTMVFESFGFKYGIPIDADYVFDVRFLPNPHWDPKLRPLTGLDRPVAAFLDRHTEVHNFIYQTRSYLELWLPMLETNNRSYLTVAIGCTGGKHRSVYIAEQLADYFRSRGKNVQSRHRTLEKKKS